MVSNAVPRTAPLLYLLAGAALALLSACGPIMSTQALSDARAEVERAGEVDADTFATYEYVSAVEFLAKAEEEWGYSDYQQARLYADEARDLAQRAYERAVRNPRRGAPQVEDLFEDL